MAWCVWEKFKYRLLQCCVLALGAAKESCTGCTRTCQSKASTMVVGARVGPRTCKAALAPFFWARAAFSSRAAAPACVCASETCSGFV